MSRINPLQFRLGGWPGRRLGVPRTFAVETANFEPAFGNIARTPFDDV